MINLPPCLMNSGLPREFTGNTMFSKFNPNSNIGKVRWIEQGPTGICNKMVSKLVN